MVGRLRKGVCLLNLHGTTAKDLNFDKLNSVYGAEILPFNDLGYGGSFNKFSETLLSCIV